MSRGTSGSYNRCSAITVSTCFLKFTSLPAACNNLVYERGRVRIRKKKHVWRHMRDMHSKKSLFTRFFLPLCRSQSKHAIINTLSALVNIFRRDLYRVQGVVSHNYKAVKNDNGKMTRQIEVIRVQIMRRYV